MHCTTKTRALNTRLNKLDSGVEGPSSLFPVLLVSFNLCGHPVFWLTHDCGWLQMPQTGCSLWKCLMRLGCPKLAPRSITLPGSQVFEFISDSVTVQLKVLMGHLLWSAESLVFLGALDQHCSSLSPHLHWWWYCIFSLLFWEKWQLKTKPILKRWCSGVYECTVCNFGPCEPLIPIIWMVWGKTSLAPDWRVQFGH